MAKESIMRLENVNEKAAEDVRSALYDIQRDFTAKLESKHADFTTKIKFEQDERQRMIDDLKIQLGIQEKSNFDVTKAEMYHMNLA